MSTSDWLFWIGGVVPWSWCCPHRCLGWLLGCAEDGPCWRWKHWFWCCQVCEVGNSYHWWCNTSSGISFTLPLVKHKDINATNKWSFNDCGNFCFLHLEALYNCKFINLLFGRWSIGLNRSSNTGFIFLCSIATVCRYICVSLLLNDSACYLVDTWYWHVVFAAVLMRRHIFRINARIRISSDLGCGEILQPSGKSRSWWRPWTTVVWVSTLPLCFPFIFVHYGRNQWWRFYGCIGTGIQMEFSRGQGKSYKNSGPSKFLSPVFPNFD